MVEESTRPWFPPALLRLMTSGKLWETLGDSLAIWIIKHYSVGLCEGSGNDISYKNKVSRIMPGRT